jgi:hypothetical protein
MISIFAFTSNRPDFIELQMRSFKKYLQEDFTYTILNNSKFDRMHEYQAIEDVCRKWQIETHDVEKDLDLIRRCNEVEKSCTVFNADGVWSNGNCAGCYGCYYTWENYIVKEKGNIALLHPDVFLDRPVCFSDYLKETPLCFIPQGRPGLDGIHMHDALVLADMSRLPDPLSINWWGSKVEGIDTDIGGQTYFYLKNHPDLKPTLIQPWFKKEGDFEYEVFAINDQPIALHYFRGSDWNRLGSYFHTRKTEWLKKRLNLEGQ